MKKNVKIAFCYIGVGLSALALFSGYMPGIFTAIGFTAYADHLDK